MGIRLQTAAIRASKRGSNPKAITVRKGTRSWGWERAPQLAFPAPPILLHFLGLLRAPTCQGTDAHPCWELEGPGRMHEA